jgi:hypothetical protein
MSAYWFMAMKMTDSFVCGKKLVECIGLLREAMKVTKDD